MANSDSEQSTKKEEGGWFPSTHWSVVMNAGKDSSSQAREAFGRLYQDYLPPLRAYLRREGRTEDEAQELVQGFFEFLLEHKGLAKLQRQGKFRSWLLVCLKNYLSDVWDKKRAAKRGGQAVHVAIGHQEEEPGVDPPHRGRTPDQEYEFQFAVRFLELVMGRLAQDYEGRGRERLFQCLHPLLLDKKGTQSQTEIGLVLGMKENAVNQEVSRLRKRYRAVFDEELEKLVGSRSDLEEEKRHLFAALRT